MARLVKSHIKHIDKSESDSFGTDSSFEDGSSPNSSVVDGEYKNLQNHIDDYNGDHEEIKQQPRKNS